MFVSVTQQAEQRLQQVTIGSVILWERKILFRILTKQPNICIFIPLNFVEDCDTNIMSHDIQDHLFCGLEGVDAESLSTNAVE